MLCTSFYCMVKKLKKRCFTALHDLHFVLLYGEEVKKMFYCIAYKIVGENIHALKIFFLKYLTYRNKEYIEILTYLCSLVGTCEDGFYW